MTLPPSNLDLPSFELPCPECGKKSLKSFMQLEMNNRLPCDHCRITIKVADYYGKPELEALAVRLGYSGFIVGESKKRN